MFLLLAASSYFVLLLVASSYLKKINYLYVNHSLIIGILDGLGIFSGLEKSHWAMILMVALTVLSGPLSLLATWREKNSLQLLYICFLHWTGPRPIQTATGDIIHIPPVIQLVLMIHWISAQHVPLIYSMQVNFVMFSFKTAIWIKLKWPKRVKITPDKFCN